MAISPEDTLTASSPVDAISGPDDSLFITMSDLGPSPGSGRLLRGLTPFLEGQTGKNIFLFTERSRVEEWRDGEEGRSYWELVHWERGNGKGIYRGVCVQGPPPDLESIQKSFLASPLTLIEEIAERYKNAVISTAEPLQLEVLHVEKPWGREGWYTGVENRGVCRIRTKTGTTELPYALGMFPIALLGREDTSLILLKTLEPLPAEVYGDLYLEVHEKKWENYLVLDISGEAWKDGVGYLRAGLNPKKIESLRSQNPTGWEGDLTEQLGAAIKAYEKTRREIDGLLDTLTSAQKLPATGFFPPEKLEQFKKQIPAPLRKLEVQQRKAVEAFLGVLPLREEDVVSLPPGVLHSLQHGVKVVEFQTPTYERLIAMFAQKVVTQPHWDTDKALKWMDKSEFTPAQPEPLPSLSSDVLMERIVDFPQFKVVRTRLRKGASRENPEEGAGDYRLLFVTRGKGTLRLADGQTFPLGREEAWLIPSLLESFSLETTSGMTFLLAYPEPLPPDERETL